MSQGSTTVADGSGAVVLAGVNAALATLLTNSSGAGAPAAPVAYQFWADTTTGLLKQRNAANTAWVTLGSLADLGIQSSNQTSAVAAGTANALTAAFAPALTAYISGAPFSVRPSAANTTTTPTISFNGLAAKTIVKGAGSPLAAGDIAGGGHWIELQYDATLDKIVLRNPATGVTPVVTPVASIQGAFKNLQASATGLSASVSVTADEIIVESSANTYQTLRSVSLTIAGTSVGANGLDTGALAINTWYSLWVIGNGTTTAGLMSLSATAPTLPGGYTHKARVGWARTDGTANKFPLAFKQFGRRVQYAIGAGSNIASPLTMASGVAGSTTTPTYVAAGVSGFVPPTASQIIGSFFQGTGVSEMLVAPNGSYGTPSGANAPPVYFLGAGNSFYTGGMFNFVLESANIYWATSGAGNRIICNGWEDNL